MRKSDLADMKSPDDKISTKALPSGASVRKPPDGRRIAERAAAELEARLAVPLPGGLYLVATPIGNLGDVTLRALAVMAAADRLYCEDTRQSQKLLTRFAISRRLDIYQEHNAERERPRILDALERRMSVALISDAGTPLISDPGFKLVRAVIEAGHPVYPLPGASAPMAALVCAGLPTDSFHFAGFLPSKTVARRERIEALGVITATLILFESPSRLAEALRALADILGPRPAVVARELTKLNEHHHRGTLGELADWAAATSVKGEIVILIGAGSEQPTTDEAILAALEPALAAGSVRDAAASVATRLGVSRSRVYDLALAVKHSHTARPIATGEDPDPC